jgi:hypothetical protein
MRRFLVETLYERFETVATTCYIVTLDRVRCVKGYLFPREAGYSNLYSTYVTSIRRCPNVTAIIIQDIEV